jgi:hypothetical protein
MLAADLAFHSNADSDPAFKNNADPCGSGSATPGAVGLIYTQAGFSHYKTKKITRGVGGLSFLGGGV